MADEVSPRDADVTPSRVSSGGVQREFIVGGCKGIITINVDDGSKPATITVVMHDYSLSIVLAPRRGDAAKSVVDELLAARDPRCD